MRNLYKVFWISFAIYSILTFLGTIVIERNENDLGFLINMKGYISLMKYYTLVGLFFYFIAFGLMFRNRIRLKKMKSNFDIEKQELKAKISDLLRTQGGAGDQKERSSPEPEE